jgi:hypothetical protein
MSLRFFYLCTEETATHFSHASDGYLLLIYHIYQITWENISYNTKYATISFTVINKDHQRVICNNPWRRTDRRYQRLGLAISDKKLFRGRRNRRNNGLFRRNSGCSAEQKTPLFYTTVLYPTYAEGTGALRTSIGVHSCHSQIENLNSISRNCFSENQFHGRTNSPKGISS